MGRRGKQIRRFQRPTVLALRGERRNGKPVIRVRYLGYMPQISSFYGISILMFVGDHNPPHFHARYGGSSARFGLDGTLLDGELPRRAKRLVLEWATIHSDELATCWEQVIKHELPGTIEPLR